MITGDQLVTAGEIARQLGIDQDVRGRPLKAVHGRDLNDLDATQWQRIVSTTAVFARVSPEAEAADRRSPPGARRRSWP